MLDIWGVISIVFFYLLILAVGIWAGRKGSGEPSEDEVMLAGRNIGIFVGIFTMTATWISGGFINGTAEVIYTTGLVWCQLPFGFALSLVVGGIFFANPMRSQGYVTMLDPLQDAFGGKMGGLLFLPAFCGEILWVAGILAALGATLSVIIDMDQYASIIFTACIVVFYTLFGGLYSVVYTDILQLFCIFIGLWLCIPFALYHPAVGSLTDPGIDWIGHLRSNDYGQWIDYALLIIFGSVPMQVYFQRVLASKTAHTAQIVSYVAAVGCILMAIPPVLIGAIAKVTDWSQTTYGDMYGGRDPFSRGESHLVLPLVVRHLTPDVVSFLGLGAVSAAIMASADSYVLSASTMFARNIYRLILRQRASEIEIIWVMRGSILIVGSVATLMALTVRRIYGLWTLSSDLVYVILFPQLLMAVHFRKYCNTYGSLAAYIVALILRVGGGEVQLNIPVLIQFPYFEPADHTKGTWEMQRFPFRTFSMLLSLFTLAGVSKLTDWVFHSEVLKAKYDYFRCVVNISEDTVKLDEDNGGEVAIAFMAKKYCGMEEINNGSINPVMSDPDRDSNGKPIGSDSCGSLKTGCGSMGMKGQSKTWILGHSSGSNTGRLATGGEKASISGPPLSRQGRDSTSPT